MKTLLAVGLLITSSAFAKIISEEPSILTTQEVKVKVSNFCIAGDKVETKTAVSYCTEYNKVWVRDNGAGGRSDGHWNYECVASEFGKLSHPIKYTKATCHRELIREGDDKYLSPCTFTYAPATLATSYTFNIYKTTRSQTDYDVMTGQGLRKIKTKTVNLPVCN